MLKVISFSLYGDNPKYTIGAVRNAQLKDIYFKEWEMWVYHNDSVPKIILDELAALHVRLINTQEDCGYLGSLWRFLAIDEPDVEYFISRDCDSRISLRDEVAVCEWINSGKKFHIIRDHPVGHRWLINAGMWGATGKSIPDFFKLMKSYILENNNNNTDDCFTMDQCFLGDVIYRFAVSSLFLHDEFFNYEGIGTNIKRDRRVDEFAFIGEVLDANDVPERNDRVHITDLYNN